MGRENLAASMFKRIDRAQARERNMARREAGTLFWEEPLQPGMQDGWITPDGTIFQCRADQHQVCAEVIAKDLFAHIGSGARIVLFENGYVQVQLGVLNLGNNALNPRQEALLIANHFILPGSKESQEQLIALIPKILGYINKNLPEFKTLFPLVYSQICEFLLQNHGAISGYSESNSAKYREIEKLYDVLLAMFEAKTIYKGRGQLYIGDEKEVAPFWKSDTGTQIFLMRRYHSHSDEDEFRGVDIHLELMDAQTLSRREPEIMRTVAPTILSI